MNHKRIFIYIVTLLTYKLVVFFVRLEGKDNMNKPPFSKISNKFTPSKVNSLK